MQLINNKTIKKTLSQHIVNKKISTQADHEKVTNNNK